MRRHAFARAVLRALVGIALTSSALAAAAPLLLRNPSLSQDKIAFLYANDVWVVAREGGVVASSSGVQLVAEAFADAPVDTLIRESLRAMGR